MTTGTILEIPSKTSFLVLCFHLMLTYVKIIQGRGLKKLEIIQRNHSLLPTYSRNVGLLNLLIHFANQNSIWWGFYWPAATIFCFFFFLFFNLKVSLVCFSTKQAITQFTACWPWEDSGYSPKLFCVLCQILQVQKVVLL